MPCGLLISLLISLLGLAAGCSDSVGAEVPDGPNRFVLEVGGDGRPLRESLGLPPLQRSGPSRPFANPRRTDPGPVLPDPIPERPIDPGPAEVTPKIPAKTTLREGETLSGVSRRVFGTTRRWEEIAELNGWTTEQQRRRLRAGTEILLPQN